MSDTITKNPTASVFVTTYHIGNTIGFGAGKWFNLNDYSDRDEFLEAATEYAKNELNDADPELCFSDFECNFNNPDNEHLGTDHVSPAVWEILQMNADDLEMLDAYIDAFGERGEPAELLSKAKDAYVGEFDSWADFAEQMTVETYGEALNELPNMVRNNINWDAVSSDYQMDHAESNGYYFRNY